MEPTVNATTHYAETREWVIPKTPFIIPYRVHQEHVEIIRVFHSARQWPKGF